MYENTKKQHKIALIAIFLVLSIHNLAASEPHPWADNVCNVSVPIKKDMSVEYPVTHQFKVRSMCGLLPCEKMRTETRIDQKIMTVVHSINKITCCPGYAETLNRRCLPICSDPCGPNGECVAPDVCKCLSEPSQSAPGFTGATCRRYVCLEINRWGPSCERECHSRCSNNSYCSADTGKCVCNPGWHGSNCSLECGPNDSMNSGCSFISQMKPVIEPDANLVETDKNLVLARTQKAEALVFDGNGEDVKMVSSMDSSNAWASLASSYLIGLLSIMSLVLLVAFLMMKKRYDRAREQLRCTSVESYSTGSGSASGSPVSNYSSSTYYTAPSAMTPAGKNLQQNLSFAAATRSILSGNVSNSCQPEGKNILGISPKTESHLLRSQKASQQNIYSDIDLANRYRVQTSVNTRRNDDDDDHIYQQPRKSPASNVSPSIRDDDDSNIYEEIKPRNGGGSENL